MLAKKTRLVQDQYQAMQICRAASRHHALKSILTKGRKPLHAASRVLNASSASASSAFAKCWVHGTNRTSALIRTVKFSGLRRAYSTKNGPGYDESTQGTSTGFDTSLYRKIINAWNDTPTKWYPLPLAVGALLLVAMQYRKKVAAAKKEVQVNEDGLEIIKLKGPWQVHVIGALPLRNMSRVWGWVNSLELPVWLRPYGFRLYAFAFGCNLDEIERELSSYVSLGDFFYRRLKPGARPVDPAVLVSPADGKILHFGKITDQRVEQVKGITYSLDALLGVDRGTQPDVAVSHSRDISVVDDQEFANVNGIEYSLDQLLGVSTSGTTTPTESQSTQPTSLESQPQHPKKFGARVDASVVEPERDMQETLFHDASVALEVGMKRPSIGRQPSTGPSAKPGNDLFFTVIYLAPGDYHRFHSPTAWVVEKRRHFVGELYSVSPYMAKRLENLFVLNERVALLGRWKHGFFSMVPVGATNVGSIMLNFDQALRTNLRGKPPPPGTYSEAVYSEASPILNGQPLTAAQEMGGFCLGSTIVLVFEAPQDFKFAITAGQKVKVGQQLGDVVAKEKQA